MSTLRYVNLQWLDHNSARRYPLAADATAKDRGGAFEVPDEFIVGLYLPIHVSLNVQAQHFMLKSIAAYGGGYTITIGYYDGTDVNTVAVATVPRATHTTNTSYILRGVDEFYDSLGSITIGKLEGIDAQPPGLWYFDLEGSRLEVDAIRPQLRGVTSLRIMNGDTLSDAITGDVVLRAGTNFRITPTLELDEDPIIIFDAIEGAGLNEECVCVTDIEASPPIRTINKIPPTADGNFTLLGNDCLELNEIENGLEINDTCAKPCCGCQELATVTTALEEFGQAATTMQNFMVNLEARVTQMDLSVLGSKLSDRGCGCD